jgi:hypothetical protein
LLSHGRDHKTALINLMFKHDIHIVHSVHGGDISALMVLPFFFFFFFYLFVLCEQTIHQHSSSSPIEHYLTRYSSPSLHGTRFIHFTIINITILIMTLALIPFVYSCIYSFIHSFIHSFIDLSTIPFHSRRIVYDHHIMDILF